MKTKFLSPLAVLAILCTISLCKLQSMKTTRQCFRTNLIKIIFEKDMRSE